MEAYKNTDILKMGQNNYSYMRYGKPLLEFFFSQVPDVIINHCIKNPITESIQELQKKIA